MPDKVVIITGASSGIGEAVARLAARRGYRVVLFARREEKLKALADRIAAKGGEALVVVGDATSLEDQQRLVEQTIAKYGRIDILMNNAGLPLPTAFSESSPEELRRQWETNVVTIATLTRIALPHLLATKGTVINIGSLISRMAVPSMGNYSPTKIAVAGLNNALRRELWSQGVKVCLVEPGPIHTEFGERAGNGGSSVTGPLHVPVSAAARPIVRLFEHPRKLVVIPGWMRPVLGVAGEVGRVASPLVDVVMDRIGGRIAQGV